jgi:hypothetical protein
MQKRTTQWLLLPLWFGLSVLALPSSTQAAEKQGSFGVSFGKSLGSATSSTGEKASYHQVQLFLNEVIGPSNKMELSYSSSTGPRFSSQTLKTKILAFDYFAQQGGTGFYARVGLGYADHEETIGTKTVRVKEVVPRAGVGYEWMGSSQFGLRFDVGYDFGVGKKPDQKWDGNMLKFSVGVFTGL